MVKIGLVEKIYNWMESVIMDKLVAQYMMHVSSRHPRMDKIWNRWSDTPVDGTLESYIHAAKFFPSVWLKPVK